MSLNPNYTLELPLKPSTGFTLAIAITCFYCNTAVAQIADGSFKSETAKVLQTEVLSGIADLRAEYERELESLKNQYEAKLAKTLENAVSKIDTAKSESTKADKLDEALELRTLAAAIGESDPILLLKPPVDTKTDHNSLTNETRIGNLANRKEKLSLAISGGKKKVANWNGEDKIRVEQISSRNWVKFSNGGFGELVQHENMLLVFMWDGTLGDTLPTKNPNRLGILYRE